MLLSSYLLVSVYTFSTLLQVREIHLVREGRFLTFLLQFSKDFLMEILRALRILDGEYGNGCLYWALIRPCSPEANKVPNKR